MAEGLSEKLADKKTFHTLLHIGRPRIGVNCDKIVYKIKGAHFYCSYFSYKRSSYYVIECVSP